MKETAFTVYVLSANCHCSTVRGPGSGHSAMQARPSSMPLKMLRMAWPMRR